MYISVFIAECQCFGHTDICFYDQTVADKRASLNINGEYEGGGVCIKCQVINFTCS